MTFRASRLATICVLAFPLLLVQPRPPLRNVVVPPAVSVSPVDLRDESPNPAVVEVTITAAKARIGFVPAGATEAIAYNGTVPGPTLVAKEGDRVVVHFRNRLDEPSTIHWHGMHIPFTADGSPYHPVAAGADFDYVFTVPRGAAGTYWYHPHPGHRTGHQVGQGLFGALIVRAARDPMPSSYREQVLVLSDNRFRPDGSFDIPERHSLGARIDEENGREGNVLFVNGKSNPTLSMRPGEIQRWRIVNASAARVYRLAIAGQSFTHVGSDGGLFEHPVELKELVLAPAERAEILVRASGTPGGTTALQALPYDRYIPQTRPADWKATRELLTIAYADQPPVNAAEVPVTLRRVPPLDPAQATATRSIALSQGMINGRKMDMDRIDITAPLGATEIWEVENLVGMDHPFHLHGFQFQVLERNGVPEAQRMWKDVVNVPKHETARFIVRYDDFAGKWMFHCHILDHEDLGMMGVLEVTQRRPQ